MRICGRTQATKHALKGARVGEYQGTSWRWKIWRCAKPNISQGSLQTAVLNPYNSVRRNAGGVLLDFFATCANNPQ